MRNSQPKGLKGMEIFLNTTCFHERWSEIMDRGACLLEQPHLPGLVKPWGFHPVNWPKPQSWYTVELRWTPGGMWPQTCLIHSWKRPCWSAQASYSLTFRRVSASCKPSIFRWWNRDRKRFSMLLKTTQQTSAELKPEPTFPDSRPSAHTP